MKRGIALLLAAALALLLCGCEKESAATLQIGETAFSEGVYAYVLHQVLRNADENATREELQQKAAEECAVYAALEARLQTEGVKLSAPHKSEAAARTRGLWQFFSAHYRALGVEKPDLTRLMTWEAAKKALTEHIYGEGGKHEVSESKLKTLFTETYAGYLGFSEALNKANARGETAPLSETEQAALRKALGELQQRAQKGESLNSLYREYSKNKGLPVTTDLEVTVIRQGDPTVRSDFFEKVHGLKTNETAVLEDGTRLVLLQKIDLLEEDAPYFAAARDDVLLAEKLPAVEKELCEQADASGAVFDEAVCSRIFARIRNVRQEA